MRQHRAHVLMFVTVPTLCHLSPPSPIFCPPQGRKATFDSLHPRHLLHVISRISFLTELRGGDVCFQDHSGIFLPLPSNPCTQHPRPSSLGAETPCLCHQLLGCGRGVLGVALSWESGCWVFPWLCSHSLSLESRYFSLVGFACLVFKMRWLNSVIFQFLSY